MQNTSAVFEKSYQAEHIRVNPLRLRFMPSYPDEEAWHSEPLEQAMRTMILKRDPNAPVAASTEYLQSFERRRDVFALRRRLDEAKATKDRTTWRPLYFQLKRLLDNLSRQAVVKMRTEYFDRVDRLRALGRSTSEEAASAAAASRAKHVRLCRGGNALNRVARYIRLHSDMAEQRPERPNTPHSKSWYLELLVGYLTNQPVMPERQTEHDEGEVPGWEVTGAARPSQEGGKHTCLLCRESFSSVDALTGHCKSLHVQKGAFDRPFPCPECHRRGSPEEHLITSPSSWSGHVEMQHGSNDAPTLRTDPLPAAQETKLCCPFCGVYIRQGRGFHMHRTSHVRNGAASAIFLSPFPCRACRNGQGGDGKQDVMIDGCSAWDTHVSLAHADAEGDWFVQGPSDPSGLSTGDEPPVCLLCDDRRSFASQRALTEHCKTVHVKNGRKFDKPFSCPECRRCAMPDHSITCASAWTSHVAMAHGRANIPKLRTVLRPTPSETKPDSHILLTRDDVESSRLVEAPAAVPRSNQKPVCLLCDDRRSFSLKSNLTAHCKTKHIERGEFSRPFPCPECRRCHKPDHLVTTPSSWSSHVESAHGRANAPTLRSEPAPSRTTLCPFCGLISSGKHRANHIRDGPASGIFSKPFPCQACRSDSQPGGGNQDVMIDGCSAWNAHVFSAHVEISRAWSVGTQPVGIKRKREGGNAESDLIQCFLCDGPFAPRGIWTHFMRTHLPVLASGSVSCLECARHQGKDATTSRITGVDAWNEHLQSVHCDLFWHFTASRSSFAVAEPSPGTQTSVVGEETGIEAVTPGGCSGSSTSAIHGDDEWGEAPGDSFETLEPAFPCHELRRWVSPDPDHVITGASSCLRYSFNEQGGGEEQRGVVDGCSERDVLVTSAHGEVTHLWTVKDRVAPGKRQRCSDVRSRRSAIAQDGMTAPASTDVPYTETAVPPQASDLVPIDPLLLETACAWDKSELWRR
jgi:hypothetical protein